MNDTNTSNTSNKELDRIEFNKLLKDTRLAFQTVIKQNKKKDKPKQK